MNTSCNKSVNFSFTVTVMFVMALYSAFSLMTMPCYAQKNEQSDDQQSTAAERAIQWQNSRTTAPSRLKDIVVPVLIRGIDFKKDLRLTVSKARVIKVIDEQTLVLDNKTTVNLAGLYFVYNRNGRGPDAIATYQFLNTEFLGQFVRVYQTRTESTGRLNSFGHQLAHIEREDGVWAQGSLLASGLARVYTNAENPEMTSEMLEIERKARLHKTGYWSALEWQIRNADQPDDIKPESFQIVEGMITKIALRNNNIYLNFGEDWRTDFTIQIATAQRKLFSRLGKTPMDWAFKKIRVRGWTEDYNGPMINIIHPYQIEFIDGESASVTPVETRYPEDF